MAEIENYKPNLYDSKEEAKNNEDRKIEKVVS